MKILLESPILTQSGYGVHARLVYQSIKDLGMEVHLCPLRWGNTPWITPDQDSEVMRDISLFEQYQNACRQSSTQPHYDIQIHVGILSEFTKKAPYSVSVTAGIETDRVSSDWLIKTHQGVDKIIVPSEHAKKGFVETSYEIMVQNKETGENSKQLLSCNCPVDVVPYPVKNLESTNLDVVFDTEFNFLTVALLGPRKNIENSISWFLQEFKDDENVGLILKTGLSRASEIDKINTREHLSRITSRFPDSKCKVYLIHGNMSDEEVNSLYNHSSVKAYLSSTHGEGYGLPIFEAACNGLPVVATDWSGHLDFLQGEIKENNKTKNKKLFARVECEISEIPKSVVWDKILIEGSMWANPTESSFKSQMRKMYKNYGMYKKWANILQEKIRNTHSQESILEQMSNSLIPSDRRPDLDWLSALDEIEVL